MAGELDLIKLRRQMEPKVHGETFVYCCLLDFQVPAGLVPICTFAEAEGLTAIVPKAQAERLGIPFEFESAMITLTVHSSLDAIGFLAVVSAALAAKDIPCNVVSAYYHDHLLVPPGKLPESLAVLKALAERGQP